MERNEIDIFLPIPTIGNYAITWTFRDRTVREQVKWNRNTNCHLRRHSHRLYNIFPWFWFQLQSKWNIFNFICTTNNLVDFRYYTNQFDLCHFVHFISFFKRWLRQNQQRSTMANSTILNDYKFENPKIAQFIIMHLKMQLHLNGFICCGWHSVYKIHHHQVNVCIHSRNRKSCCRRNE